MKKAIVIISIFIVFLIIYFLQANFFNWFTIAGIKPNLFVILILFISLFIGIKAGISFSLFFGLFLDIVLGKNLGTYTIMLTLVALLGWYFDKNFSKDSRAIIMLMVILATVLFEIGAYILSILILSINVEIIQFIKVLLVETIYNAIIIIIFYSVFQKLGYKVEDIFKGQNVLTRYF